MEASIKLASYQHPCLENRACTQTFFTAYVQTKILWVRGVHTILMRHAQLMFVKLFSSSLQKTDPTAIICIVFK